MAKRIITTKLAPAAIGPYSQAVEYEGTLYCSGQIAIDPKTGEVSKGGVQEQTALVMKNIEGLLKASDFEFNHVVKTTIYLVDMNDFATVNEIYGSYFKTNPPARSTIAVAGLPKGVKVEIEVLARR